MAAIVGTNGNDNLVSPEASSNDTINALAGDDRIEARGGDDLILPGPGNDRIEGGDGRDDVLLPGSLDQYELYRYTAFGNEGVIRGPEGVDTLLDVEAIRTDISGTREFSDVPEFLSYAYLASYADLSAAFGEDRDAAWDHFYQVGAVEGREITFDGAGYLAANPDVLAAQGGNVDDAALHYLRFGRAEGRQTDFDGAQYVASHADLIAAFRGQGDADALGTNHYVSFGLNEGRATDTFNETSYAALNPDLAVAGVVSAEALAEHWITHGAVEGRAGAYDPLIA
jgi:hypothetical protein